MLKKKGKQRGPRWKKDKIDKNEWIWPHLPSFHQLFKFGNCNDWHCFRPSIEEGAEDRFL